MQLLVVVLILVFCRLEKDDEPNLLAFCDVVKVQKGQRAKFIIFISF
jgi:hypothetical protein